MKLTVEEFHRIRPLEWVIRSYGDNNKSYNSPVDMIETRLFWLDFIRNVFSPKFAAQRGITHIANFDLTQPVLLSDDLELRLPSVLESVVYFANASNNVDSKKFALPFDQLPALIVGVMSLILLLMVHVVLNRRSRDGDRRGNIIGGRDSDGFYKYIKRLTSSQLI